MKLIIAASALVLLSACATTEPTIITKEVKVPVAVPCQVAEPTPPDLRYKPPYDNIFDAVRDLVGDRELSQAYENELRTALKSCK